MNWGPITPTNERNSRPVGASDGEPTHSTPSSYEGAPHHAVDYSATDGRHNRETGFAPWSSIDPNSGPTSSSDFGDSAGRFPDGPGVWRQT